MSSNNTLSYNVVECKDAAALSELCIETFRQAYAEQHSPTNMQIYCDEHYSVSAIEAMLARPTVEAVIVKDKGITAGFYILNAQACPVNLTGNSIELKQIYILAEHFGKGLAKAVFNRIVNQSRERDIDWIWLYVSDENSRAQRFYQKLGFSKRAAGPELIVGSDTLSSSLMLLNLGAD